MTLEEAITKVESETGEVVRVIRDCGDRWCFDFEGAEGAYTVSFVTFVFKSDWQIEYESIVNCVEIVMQGKPLEW